MAIEIDISTAPSPEHTPIRNAATPLLVGLLVALVGYVVLELGAMVAAIFKIVFLPSSCRIGANFCCRSSLGGLSSAR